jgi:alkanesulfonate monooxygenase SsuD/methylene tetrahydromethanopterin reductase-like flavin-dependent oxidoreductase (luciferase family)
MEEALGLIKRLWTEERVTHEGTYYQVNGAVVLPRPTQRPHPPVMIGGGGPRMLRIAAREAQIVAIAPSINPGGGPKVGTVTVGSVEERIATLRRAPRFSELELNVIVFDAQVTDAAQSMVEGLAAQIKSAATTIVDTPFFMYGSRASLIEDLLARRERLGISYIALPGGAMRAFAPVVAALRGK